MRRSILAACLAAFLITGCSRQAPKPPVVGNSPPAEAGLAGTRYGEYVIGEPVTHENLSVFPIYSRVAKNDDRFITLDEGLAAGTVQILEIGAGGNQSQPAVDDNPFGSRPQSDGAQPANNESRPVGDDPFREPPQDPAQQQATNTEEQAIQQTDTAGDNSVSGHVDGSVNQLLVLNKSGKPLYLMPGEVITGGNQDRTIGQELVIASSEEPVPIDVYCVEHGRWGGRTIEQTVSQLAGAAGFGENLSLVVSSAQGVDELAKEAQRGKFVASIGQLNKDARLAVRAGDQQEVWANVAKVNANLKSETTSGTFAENYVSGEVADDFEPFMKAIRPVSETRQIVGVAVAVNGKMLSVDIFESTPLFKKFWPKLLKSYALDAVAARGETDASEPAKPVLIADCIAFMQSVEKSTAETVELANGQKIDKRESDSVISFSYYDRREAAAASLDSNSDAAAAAPDGRGFGGGGFGGGGFGGGVHSGAMAR